VRIPVIGSDRPPAAPAPTAGASASAPVPPPDPALFGGTWTVEAGDTLWAIARRYGTTPEVLAAANGRSLDSPLKPGETLKVPEEEP
jgi:LysM repeat protein